MAKSLSEHCGFWRELAVGLSGYCGFWLVLPWSGPVRFQSGYTGYGISRSFNLTDVPVKGHGSVPNGYVTV